ncbi:hypothetical protein B0J14DRAFT_444838, partial [Halenospora varia]
CPPFGGNFTIHQYQLYAENADFDFDRCLLYLGSLWNASIAVYDPYKAKVVETIEFPGIAHNPTYHLGGVGIDRNSGLLSVVVDVGAAFDTSGKDISGTNYFIQYDPDSKKILYQLNLTATTKGLYGGPQDVEQDPDGNIYNVFTFPSAIVKVSKNGKKVEEWYKPTPPIVTTNAGLGGLAANGWVLLGDNSFTGELWRFDMRAEKGVPSVIPITPAYNLSFSDAIYLPPKYHGTVLLVAEDAKGISVFRSKNGKWESAEYLGLVPWTGDPAFFVTAPVQVGDGLYMVLEPFGDEKLPGQNQGGRTDFTFPDITSQVEKLL